MPDADGRENCLLPNRDQYLTAYTWGCFYYGATTPTDCPAPAVSDFPFLGYKRYTPPGNSELHLTLNTSWHWDMQTPAAYPWDFNEKLLIPQAGQPGYARGDLVNPTKENVHFLFIKDHDNSVAADLGYGSLNFGTVPSEL
jgi:hypothetical protein